MLKMYFCTTNQNLVDKLNELFADDDNVSFAMNNNAPCFIGKLWNANEVTTLTSIGNVNQGVILLDKENHFLLIQNSLNYFRGTRITNCMCYSNYAYTCYMESEDEEPIFFLYGNAINNTSNDVFLTYHNLIYGTGLDTLSNLMIQKTTNALDMDATKFTIEPWRIGKKIMKNLFISTDNACPTGTKITDGTNEYTCIGTRIFYKTK